LKGEEDNVDWSALSRPGHTVVFYMGLNQLQNIVARLREHGAPETRAAAIIEQGTRPSQRVVTATLSDLVQKAAEAQVESPALLIVGEVTRLHEALHWFNARSVEVAPTDEGRLSA
jgi:siroheme synthase